MFFLPLCSFRRNIDIAFGLLERFHVNCLSDLTCCYHLFLFDEKPTKQGDDLLLWKVCQHLCDPLVPWALDERELLSAGLSEVFDGLEKSNI